MIPQTVPIHAKALGAALRRSPRCATLEELGRLCGADHAGGGEARLAEHVAECVRCRTELALLKELEGAPPRPDEQADASWIAARLDGVLARVVGAAPARATGGAATGDPHRDVLAVIDEAATQRRRAAALQPVAVALAFAAAMLLVVLDVSGRDVHPPALSAAAADGSSAFRSNAVTLLSPAGDLDAPAEELRWEGVPGAASYSVRVMEVDRAEVFRADAREPRLALPAAVRARLVPGKPLLWQVVATGASGSVVAASQLQRFRVRLPDRRPSRRADDAR